MIEQILNIAMYVIPALISIYIAYTYAYPKIGKIGTVVFLFFLYPVLRFYLLMSTGIVISWTGASNPTDYGFGLIFLISSLVSGLVLHLYWMYIIDSDYRIIAYPIPYLMTVLGFIPLLWVLLGLHFGKYFWSGYSKAKIKKDLEN